jgi:hypothetical protein
MQIKWIWSLCQSVNEMSLFMSHCLWALYYAKIRGVSGRNYFVSVRAAFASIIERKWSPQCHLGLSALALCGAWLIFLTRRTGEKWRCDATRASPRTHRRDSYYKCYEAGNKYFIRHAYGKRCARRRAFKKGTMGPAEQQRDAAAACVSFQS